MHKGPVKLQLPCAQLFDAETDKHASRSQLLYQLLITPFTPLGKKAPGGAWQLQFNMACTMHELALRLTCSEAGSVPCMCEDQNHHTGL